LCVEEEGKFEGNLDLKEREKKFMNIMIPIEQK
jgi:hypothetical protein